MDRSNRFVRAGLILLVPLLLLGASGIALAAPNLTIGNYQLVSSKRISRLEFEYTYKASVRNAGSDALAVSATLNISAPGVTVLDGTLGFGDVAGGASVASADTFSIRQDRLYGVSETNFVWDVHATLHAAVGDVGGSGGTVAVTNPNSPIHGTIIDFPPNALGSDEQSKITIDYDDSLPGDIPLGAVPVSKVFRIEKSGQNDFEIPVSVTIPFNHSDVRPDDVPVAFYWNTVYKKYLPLTFTAIDRSEGTVTFSTAHFCSFVVFVVPAVSDIAKTDIDTGFRPGEDGFFHPNFGTTNISQGSCLGMAHFSEWYFSKKKASDGTGLYWKYRQGVVNDVLDDSIARELIARAAVVPTKEHADNAKRWGFWKGPVDTGRALLTAMSVTHEPQTLLMTEIPPFGQGSHAVTVFRWDSMKQRFEIYDNNHPGETAYLSWNSFDGFTSYSEPTEPGETQHPWIPRLFAFEPSTASSDYNHFEALYQGAEQGWDTTDFPSIEMLEPIVDNDGIVMVNDQKQVQIRGRVSDGASDLYWVSVVINQTIISIVPISTPSHEFTFTIAELLKDNPKFLKHNNDVILVASNQSRPFSSPERFYDGYKRFTLLLEQYPLNDTGITRCSNATTNGLPCPVAGFLGQDAEFGRDATHNDDSDGHAGFSFTKLDANGNALPASAAAWSCVQDNVTGRVWEVKTTSGLRSQSNTYTWYNPDTKTNGGNAGTQNGGSCTGSACDTQGYVQAVNAQDLCGKSDWRLPSQFELLSIVSNDRYGPAIDTAWFPNTPSGGWFWSSSSSAYDPDEAWFVSFLWGEVGPNYRNYAYQVRLVRGGQ